MCFIVFKMEEIQQKREFLCEIERCQQAKSDRIQHKSGMNDFRQELAGSSVTIERRQNIVGTHADG